MPQDITGRMVNNAMTLRRFENRTAAEVAKIIDEAIPKVEALLQRLDPTAVLPGNRQRRLQALQRAFNRIVDPMYTDMAKLTREELVALAQVQHAFAGRTLQAAVGAGIRVGTKEISPQQWRAVIAEDPVQGAVMGDWWTQQRATTKRNFRRAVQMGVVRGDTTPEIVRRVRGLAVQPGVYRGGVMSVSTREATALVRTAIHQISVTAQMTSYEQHSDVTEQWEYTATLDSRTTPFCATHDGRIYKYGEGPQPPNHFGCRSVGVPVVKWDDLGITPPKEGMRASKDGPVRASTDYAGWLKRQPASVQDEFFGSPKRGRLFRSGEKSLGQLVASDGKFATLEQLGAT